MKTLRQELASPPFFIKSFLLWGVLAVMLVGFIAVGYQKEMTYASSQIDANQHSILYESSIILKQTLSLVMRDTLYLGKSVYLKKLLYQKQHLKTMSESQFQQAPLNLFLENLMSSRQGIYAQLRFIGADGMEVARINNQSTGPEIVPASALQDKSKRYYFTKARNLKAGQLYISPLDLNVEHGQIETPNNPMIRFCMPVYDSAGHFKGVIVINVLFGRMIEALQRIASSHDGVLWFTNQYGDWFTGPSPQLEWRFMYPQQPSAKVADQYPVLWNSIHGLANDDHLSMTERGAYLTALKIQPFSSELYPDDQIFTNFGRGTTWYLFAVESEAKMAAVSQQIIEKFIPLFVLLNVFFAIFSFTLVLLNHRRQSALEEFRKARDQAEQASQAKSEFLSNMSHEIRTPLNAVLGMAYLLENPSIRQNSREIGRKILQAGKSLQSILNDVLDFSKIEAGKLVLSPAPFCLNDMLSNISTIMTAYAHDKEIELIISSNIPPDFCLLGDKLRIEQVLINLVGNAIKFTACGHVALTVEILTASETDNQLEFCIEDTGIGMNREEISRIFNAFEQADQSTAKSYGGTGLGLTICTRLLAMMNSELHVTSEQNKGAIFTFQLTLPTAQKTAEPLSPLQNLNVLIADDYDLALAALEKSAKALKWRTLCARNGHEAVELAKTAKDPIDLYLLDWDMPVLDGLAVARMIKAQHPDEPSPVIVMVTAYSAKDVLDSPDAKYIDLVLEKPVTPSMLYNAAINALTPAHAQSVQNTRQRLAGIRMLVVDDNEYNRDIAEQIFAGEGALVTLLNDGQAVLDWLAAHGADVDVILMDIQMPVMDGYEATRKIRENPDYQAICIIALSADVFDSHRKTALAAGMNDFIPKPFEVASAIEVIRHNLGLTEQEHQAISPVSAAAETASLINIEKAESLWGDKKVLHKYLRKFLTDYAQFEASLSELSTKEMGAAAHKLKGAAAALSLEKLMESAGTLEQACQTQKAIPASIKTLSDCLVESRQCITALLEASTRNKGMSHQAIKNEDLATVTSLLREVYLGLNEDNPNRVRPLITQLTSVMTPDYLVDIDEAIDDYEFELAKRHVEVLAQTLGIGLQE